MDVLDPEILIKLKATPGLCYDVIPFDEIDKHGDGENCWCMPTMIYHDPENQNTLWGHKRKQ